MGQTLISSHHSQSDCIPNVFLTSHPAHCPGSCSFRPGKIPGLAGLERQTSTEQTHSAALTSSSYTQWPLSSQPQSNPSPGKWSQNTSIPELSVFHSSLLLPPAGDELQGLSQAASGTLAHRGKVLGRADGCLECPGQDRGTELGQPNSYCVSLGH